MPSPSSTPNPTMPFYRRRTSDRDVPSNADSRQRLSVMSSPLPTLPGNMRGMRRLEQRRTMEENHHLAQKARAANLNPIVDMRLVDYISDYDRNLMCPICRCPLVDPVVLDSCDHCFCRECLSQTWTEYHPGGPRGNCPTCRSQSRLAAKGAVNKILTNILDELMVKCPKHEEGCTAEIKRGELQNHVNLYCTYGFVECPSVDCDQPIKRKDASQCLHFDAACIDCHDTMFVADLENHWRHHCPDRKVICTLCDNDIFYRDQEAHTKHHCPAVTTPCSGSPYGCSFKSRRGELDLHSSTCVYATLAPILSAQQKRSDEQEEAQQAMAKKVAVLEQGFERLEMLLCEDYSEPREPSNPADPQQIPLILEARTTRLSQARRRSQQGQEGGGEHRIGHDRQGSTASDVPDIDWPSPPSGHATMHHRLSNMSTLSRPQSYTNQSVPSAETYDFDGFSDNLSPDDNNQFSQPQSPEADLYTPTSASPIQHLLSLHESLRDEVTRIAAALHDLDGRHSMLMLNENLRLKEDMAFLNAQVSGIGRQVAFLSARVVGGMRQGQQNQVQSQARNQTHTQDSRGPAETGSGSEADADTESGEPGGRSLQNAVTALRGAARMVSVGGRETWLERGGRSRSDEGRTKL